MSAWYSTWRYDPAVRDRRKLYQPGSRHTISSSALTVTSVQTVNHLLSWPQTQGVHGEVPTPSVQLHHGERAIGPEFVQSNRSNKKSVEKAYLPPKPATFAFTRALIIIINGSPAGV